MSDTIVAGRYRILRRLASGGMGEVVLASQVGPEGFDKVVALKRILPNLNQDQEGVRLFLDEARLVALLSHRNICQITDLGQDADGYFVAMEYVNGCSVRSLTEKLRRAGERVHPVHALDIATQVADALAYAYAAPGRDGRPLQIIHRDVTPHNILLSTAGDVKLIDFGVAKSTAQQHHTETGTIKGKMAYLSPEQSLGRPLDARSDLFSLGVVLYEMLTGVNPFFRDDMIAMVQAIRAEEPPPLSSVDPSLQPLEPVMARLLSKSLDGRFADAAAAAEALLDAKQALPRAPQRLGPFIAERFATELADMARSITDAKARVLLEHTAPDNTPTRMKPPPVAPEPLLDAAAGPVSGDGPTAMAKSDRSGKIAPLAPSPAAPSPSSSKAPMIAGGLGGVALLSLLGWHFLSGPTPAAPLADLTVAVKKAPEPIPVAPPAPPPVVVAEPPKPEPKPEPIPEPKPDPKPVVVAKVEPEPKHRGKSDPKPKPEPKAEPKSEPVKQAALGTVHLSGTLGDASVALTSESGHVALTSAGDYKLGLDYGLKAGKVATATLTSEPWALVYVNGVNIGKTPVALPGLGASATRIELSRPGLTAAKVFLSAGP